MSDILKVLIDYQQALIAACGVALHTVLRPDVPVWQGVVMVILGMPLAVYVVAPAVVAYTAVPSEAENFVVFVLGFLGRDVIVGAAKIGRAFAANPTSFYRRRK